MTRILSKLLSPFAIAWGRTPARWKWGEPRDDLAWMRTRLARRYHPHWYRGKYLLVSNILYFFMLLAWPVRAICLITTLTARYGAATREERGISISRQFIDQARIAIRHGNNPEVYHLYCLFDEQKMATAGRFLMNNEIFALVGLLNDYVPDDAVEDKLSFNSQLREGGVRVIRDVAVVTSNGVKSFDGQPTALPEADFIVKPRRGLQGRGFDCYLHLGAGRYRTTTGEVHDAEGVTELLANTQRRLGDVVVQPRMRNHPGLSDLSVNGFCTARVLTGQWPDGGVEIIRAVLKFPVADGYADNYSIGGIASPIELSSGVLGPAVGEDVLAPEFMSHPATGARIAGRVVPCWPEAQELLRRAHALLPQFVLLAWDVGFCEEGPVVVEANRDMGMELLQKPGGRPLGDSALPHLSRLHLERRERPATLRSISGMESS